jgi:hypothetical protein
MPLEKYRYAIYIKGKGKINEVKMQNYAMALLKKEGIPFVVSAESNGGFMYEDEDLIPFIEEMGVDNSSLNIKMIRDELKIGHDRVLRIMKRLVEDKSFKEIKEGRGRKWTMRK